MNRKFATIDFRILTVLLFGVALSMAAALLLQGWVMCLVIAAVGALEIFALFLLRNRYFQRQKQAAKHLPARVENELSESDPWEWFSCLCDAFAEEHGKFQNYAVNAFFSNLTQNKSHVMVAEDAEAHLMELVTSDVIGFSWKYYCLVYLSIEEYAEYILKDCRGHLQFDGFRRIYEVVSAAFLSSLRECHAAHCVEVGKDCVCVVNLRDTSVKSTAEEMDRFLDEIDQKADEIVKSIYEEYGISVSAGISEPYQNIEDTYQQMEQLRTIMEFSRFTGGTNQVLTHRAVHDHVVPVTTHIDQNLERRYFNALLAQNIDTAEQLLLELVNGQLSKQLCDIGRLKQVLEFRLQEALQIYGDCEESIYSAAIAKMRASNTPDSLLESIHSIFDTLRQEHAKQAVSYSGAALQIKEYIDSHFRDFDLSGAVLSEVLSMSQSYISRVFKATTGSTVTDYIHTRRIEEAKKLLAESSYSVIDISEKVGYSTAWTMNRAFKRYEGVTPTAYRQACESAENAD